MMGFELPAYLSDYKLLKHIGNIKFGQVYSAIHSPTKITCAIHIIHFRDCRHKDNGDLLKELDLLVQFNSPFISTIYDYFVDDEKACIVTELCENGTLKDFLSLTQKISEKQASVFVFEILTALFELKTNNIIHRDLKLDNIKLNSNGHIRLYDFGLARFTQNPSDDMKKTFCGTPVYVSPELVARQDYSEKTDIWSLGVILYTMLYGNYPFYTENLKDLFKQITKNEPFLSDLVVSHKANDLIQKMLTKDQEKRINLEDIFDHDFLVINDPLSYRSYPRDYGMWMNRELLMQNLCCDMVTLHAETTVLTNIPTQHLQNLLKINKINGATACYKIQRDNLMKMKMSINFGNIGNDYQSIPLMACSISLYRERAEKICDNERKPGKRKLYIKNASSSIIRTRKASALPHKRINRGSVGETF
ncbi:CAMK family protein kinase [Tritrichomonas foetus]|uniref:CAMK family protein kinase n=1 Tax=Tritrichomonas foetus TaxID=1144522 RepID=A0A1J4JHX3_9EUKA|nr:CAMK family protein kinase [Tritrichomonas foetus]|eukprot:OHS98768.1 CAMK family protein kinase [Tritrichomonas foetus]